MTNPGCRRVAFHLGIVAMALATFLALGFMPPGPAEAQVSSLPLDFPDVVIFATNSVRIDHHAQVLAGHIVVNNASPGPTLSPGVELGIDKNVVTPTGYAIVGDSIDIAKDAVIGGNAFYNSLTNAGTINGSLNTPLSLPVFTPLPTFESAAPGTLDVTVAQNQTQTIAPGNYRDITLAAGATLRFSAAGVYNVRSISTGKNASLSFQGLASGTTRIRVLNQVVAGDDNVIGPDDGDPLKAAKIIFYVAFSSGSSLTPAAFSAGKNTALKANVYAPNGTLSLDHHITATGAFLARDVDIAKNVQINLETFFNQQAPTITSANSATFAPGLPGQTFTVTTTGVPTNTISRTGTLPSGVTFTDNGNNTATIAGTPAAGTQSGSPYAWVITASNGVPPNAVQNFTFNVVCPSITVSGTIPDLIFNQAMAPATFTQAGGSGTITWSATGLPNGVGINPSSGTVTGTPTQSGSFSVTITATDAGGCTGSKNLTVVVKEPPAITSANSATFAPGLAGQTFTVTTTGSPTNTITRTGTLPSGVTFTDNGNNTATIAGTPAAGTQAGSPYAWVITAANGVPPNAVQNFTFNIVCPVITVSGTIPPLVFNTAMATATFTQAGGNGPIIWSSTGLPTATSINPGSGDVTGTPTVTGTFSVTITATDAGGCAGSKSQSVTVAPVATGDSYSGLVDNTQFVITGGATASPGTPFVGATGTLIANDLPSGGVSATAGTFATSAGGSVTIAADGTFIYTPKANPGAAVTTSDSFTYTVSSNTGGGGAVASPPATVSLTLAERVWYVRNNAGGGGNGQSQAPFDTLAAGISASTANDTIYVYQGDGTTTNLATPSILKPGQRLIGQGVALVVNSNPLVPAGGFPLIGNTGASNVITVNNGNTIAGVSLINGSNALITGAPAGLTVDTVTMATSATALGFNITGGSGSVAVSSVTMSGTGTGDMVRVNTGTQAWTVSNSPLSQSGGGRALNISNKTSNGVSFDSSSPITVTNGTADGAITLTSNSAGTYVFNKIALTTTGAARGLVVGGTGTGALDILDGTSTIVSATGSAVDINGSTPTALNVSLEKVSASGAPTGILVNNTTGSFTVNGTGAAATGGVIQNASVRGARFSNATNISLNWMTFTNNGTDQGTCGDVGAVPTNNTDCGAGIDLQTVSTVTLANTTVTGGTQQGINGNTVSDLTMTNVDVTGAGDEPFENGVTMVNLTGTGTVTNSHFTNSFSRQWEIQNYAGVLDLTISGGSFNYSAPGVGTNAYGFHLSAQGTADNTVTVTGATFQNNFSAGFRTDSANTATVNATVGDDANAVLGNTFTNNGVSIQILVNNASDTTFDLGLNTMTQAGLVAGATNLIVRKGSGTTGTVDGRIVANNIGNGTANSGSGCTACNGVSLQNDGTSGDYTVQVTGNAIQHVRQRGLEVLASISDRTKVIIQNNSFSNPDGAIGEAIFVQSGSIATDTTTVCGTIGGAGGLANTITGVWNSGNPGNGAIRVRNRFVGTIFDLPGFPGPANSAAAAVTFIQGNNSMGGNIASATLNGNVFGSVCPF